MIRQVQIDDLDEIVRVHSDCFPNSFSTQMGSNLLKKMYLEYFIQSPELFLLAEENDECIGFVMGYYFDRENCLTQFKKKNRLCFFFTTLKLLITFNKPAWKKLKDFLRFSNSFVTINDSVNCFSKAEMADLLSICVIDPFRGKGTANQLIEEYENVLKDHNIRVCMLTVSTENNRGIAFYEKHGYSICRKADGCNTYFKSIIGE